MRLVMLGGTGSGKGTQAARLCDRFNISSISTGNILREAIAAGTDLGKQVQPYVNKGELVPDELMIQLIKQRLLASDVNQGWILEGYPRTSFQAEELDFLLEELQQKINWAIYLQVSESTMKERSLQRGLPDDRAEVIERRIHNFRETTIPILEYYSYCNRLLTIQGEQSPDAVEQEIVDKLNKI